MLALRREFINIAYTCLCLHSPQRQQLPHKVADRYCVLLILSISFLYEMSANFTMVRVHVCCNVHFNTHLAMNVAVQGKGQRWGLRKEGVATTCLSQVH